MNVHLTGKSVKRLNRFLLVSAEDLSSQRTGDSVDGLIMAIAELVPSLVPYTIGTLLFIDESGTGKLKTTASGIQFFRSRSAGILGYVATTGECVSLNNMRLDPRYDPESDNLMVGLLADATKALDGSPSERALLAQAAAKRRGSQDSPSKGETSSWAVVRRSSLNKRGVNHALSEGEQAPDAAVVCFPLKSAAGQVLGVFTVAIVDPPRRNSDPKEGAPRKQQPLRHFFSPDDITLMAFLSAQATARYESIISGGGGSPRKDADSPRRAPTQRRASVIPPSQRRMTMADRSAMVSPKNSERAQVSALDERSHYVETRIREHPPVLRSIDTSRPKHQPKPTRQPKRIATERHEHIRTRRRGDLRTAAREPACALTEPRDDAGRWHGPEHPWELAVTRAVAGAVA